MIARWYVVATEPRAEKFASDNLKEAGFEVFFPELRTLVPVRRSNPPRSEERKEPLFAGYVFVRLDLAAPWLAVCRTRGVRHLLPVGRELPLPMPAGSVEELMRANAEMMAATLDEVVEASFQPGQPLRVRSGAFWGMNATCLATKGQRVQALLTMFGRQSQAWLRADQVEAVG